MSATARRLLRPEEQERSRRIQHGVPAGDSRTSSRQGSDVDHLVARYLPLAEKLASRYRHSPEPLDDLVQVARLGLVKAASRWEPGRGLAFSSYAVPTILGELRRHFRDHTWAVKPPRDLQELSLAVRRARDDLWQELGREPTAQDVAVHLDRPLEAILEAIEANHSYVAASLDAPVHDDEADSASRYETISDPCAGLEGSDDRVALEQLSTVLAERQRRVLHLRFCEDLTQKEIGERIGCSQMHVSRILRDALNRLRAAEDHARTG